MLRLLPINRVESESLSCRVAEPEVFAPPTSPLLFLLTDLYFEPLLLVDLIIISFILIWTILFVKVLFILFRDVDLFSITFLYLIKLNSSSSWLFLAREPSWGITRPTKKASPSSASVPL